MRWVRVYQRRDSTWQDFVLDSLWSGCVFSNMAVPRDTGIELAGSNLSGEEQAAPHIPQSTPQHPPTSISSTSFSSHQSKCKYSAFDGGDSMSLKSSSFTSSQEKCQCNTGASALYSLGAKVDKMSKTFAHGSNPRHIAILTNLHSAGQQWPKAFRGLSGA